MGVLEKIIRLTPFYQLYKEYLKRKAETAHRSLEEKLHPRRVAFYSQFIKPGDLVFDVGANIGNRVVSFLECKAKVVAIEPQPSCVSILKNKFGDRIAIESIGLGAQAGELEMQIATDSTVSSFNQDYVKNTRERFKYTEWVDTIKIPVRTMDDLLSVYGKPVFCKIDVEGFELEVLKGLHEPLPLLSLEFCVPEMHMELLECLHYLNGLSPQGSFNYSIGESMEWALPDWVDFKVFLEHVQSSDFAKTSFGDVYFRSHRSD